MSGGWTAHEMGRLWKHDDFLARVYADRRLSLALRDLILAIGWMVLRDPAGADLTGDAYWDRVQELTEGPRAGLGRNWPGYQRTIAEDLPRYWGPEFISSGGRCEGPRARPYRARPLAQTGRCMVPAHPHRGTCQYPPPRPVRPEVREREEREAQARDGVCGEPTRAAYAIEHDPVTGEHRLHWFCRRHERQAKEMQARLVEPNRAAPVPVPNRGGLLPCHLSYPDESGWVQTYRWASGRDGWEPPVWGVCADAWPVVGSAGAPVPVRPALVLLRGGLHEAARGEELG